MPRPGYRSLSIPDDIFELLNKMKKKHNLPSTELIRRALIIYDKVAEALKEIEESEE